MPFIGSREDIKARAKLVYLADETEAISLPAKSPSLVNIYDKILKDNKELSDKSIFHTHFESRNVLL